MLAGWIWPIVEATTTQINLDTPDPKASLAIRAVGKFVACGRVPNAPASRRDRQMVAMQVISETSGGKTSQPVPIGATAMNVVLKGEH